MQGIGFSRDPEETAPPISFWTTGLHIYLYCFESTNSVEICYRTNGKNTNTQLSLGMKKAPD